MFFTWSLENKLSAIWCCIFRDGYNWLDADGVYFNKYILHSLSITSDFPMFLKMMSMATCIGPTYAACLNRRSMGPSQATW